jgi:hypothetical protein
MVKIEYIHGRHGTNSFIPAFLLLYPFETLNPGSGPIDLLGSSRLTFSDEAYPIICTDREYLCYGIYPILPAVDPDLAWPIPFIFVQLNIDEFNQIEYGNMSCFIHFG